MPTLTIMRHGQAEDSPGTADRERGLTQTGRDELVQVAAGLGALDVHPDLILASPYRRTVETAQAIALRIAEGRAVETMPELAPAAAPVEVAFERIAEAVATSGGASSILVVGHLPDISYLTGFALAGQPCRAVDFAPATAAHLICLGALRPGAGTLVWALRADKLACLGR